MDQRRIVDLRTAAQQAREAAKLYGDFEWAAANMVARLTGDVVILQDTNSKQGMPDLRIEYVDRPPA